MDGLSTSRLISPRLAPQSMKAFKLNARTPCASDIQGEMNKKVLETNIIVVYKPSISSQRVTHYSVVDDLTRTSHNVCSTEEIIEAGASDF